MIGKKNIPSRSQNAIVKKNQLRGKSSPLIQKAVKTSPWISSGAPRKAVPPWPSLGMPAKAAPPRPLANTKIATSPQQSQGKKEPDNKLFSEQNMKREGIRASGRALTNLSTETAVRSANQVGKETKPFLPDEYYQKIDSNIAKANAARDAEVARIQSLSKTQQSKYTTVASGVDLRTGEVFTGAKNSKLYKQQASCVEDIVHRGLGGDQMSNIIMTSAKRPRDGKIIDVCDRCQTRYPKNQFVKGTEFAPMPQAAKTADTAADAVKASTAANATADIAGDALKSGAHSGWRTAAKVGGKALAVAGVAMDAKELYDSYQSDGGKIGENTVTSAGGIAGSWGGAAIGAKAGAIGGAALGSVIPVVGTAVGGVVGGILGGIVGGIGGNWFGKKVANTAYNEVVN